MQRSRLSLKWLEIFQLAARSGSVRAVAGETGLSVSTVSHHLKRLEDMLGISLMDHTRRPMVLTPAGAVFLRKAEQALRLIREAEIEATTSRLVEARSLRLALIEDFDSEIAPELARFLALGMRNCEFTHYTRPSHEILHLLRNRQIDVGVATKPADDVSDLVEYPILRDPFVVATPVGEDLSPERFLAGESELPFLRYSQSQIIGRQIEAQLRRLRVSLPNRFQIESNQSIMGMVAERGGWAITTPTCFIRTQRFHKQITLRRFPGKGFARTLSLFTTQEYAQNVADLIAGGLRRLVRTRAIEPTVQIMPWLKDSFLLLDDH